MIGVSTNAPLLRYLNLYPYYPLILYNLAIL
jgi:hypothetical protein